MEAFVTARHPGGLFLLLLPGCWSTDSTLNLFFWRGAGKATFYSQAAEICSFGLLGSYTSQPERIIKYRSVSFQNHLMIQTAL